MTIQEWIDKWQVKIISLKRVNTSEPVWYIPDPTLSYTATLHADNLPAKCRGKVEYVIEVSPSCENGSARSGYQCDYTSGVGCLDRLPKSLLVANNGSLLVGNLPFKCSDAIRHFLLDRKALVPRAFEYTQGAKFDEKFLADTLENLMDCLHLDFNGVVNCHSFEEYASEYDMNPDSRKDEALYQHVCRCFTEFKKVFPWAAIMELLNETEGL